MARKVASPAPVLRFVGGPNDIRILTDISDQSFAAGWTEDVFLHCLRQRTISAKIAEFDGLAVGFVVWELQSSAINLLNLAVVPEFQRRGIGRALIEEVESTLKGRRKKILFETPERNLDACLFFRRLGYRAISMLKRHYDDDQDAILFEKRKA